MKNTLIEIYKSFYVEIYSPDFPPPAFCESISSMKSVNMIWKRQKISKIVFMSVHTRIYSPSILRSNITHKMCKHEICFIWYKTKCLKFYNNFYEKTYTPEEFSMSASFAAILPIKSANMRSNKNFKKWINKKWKKNLLTPKFYFFLFRIFLQTFQLDKKMAIGNTKFSLE